MSDPNRYPLDPPQDYRPQYPDPRYPPPPPLYPNLPPAGQQQLRPNPKHENLQTIYQQARKDHKSGEGSGEARKYYINNSFLGKYELIRKEDKRTPYSGEKHELVPVLKDKGVGVLFEAETRRDRRTGEKKVKAKPIGFVRKKGKKGEGSGAKEKEKVKERERGRSRERRGSPERERERENDGRKEGARVVDWLRSLSQGPRRGESVDRRRESDRHGEERRYREAGRDRSVGRAQEWRIMEDDYEHGHGERVMHELQSDQVYDPRGRNERQGY